MCLEINDIILQLRHSSPIININLPMVRRIRADRRVAHHHQHTLVGLAGVAAVGESCDVPRGDIQGLRNRAVAKDAQAGYIDDLRGAVELLDETTDFDDMTDVLVDPGVWLGLGRGRARG